MPARRSRARRRGQAIASALFWPSKPRCGSSCVACRHPRSREAAQRRLRHGIRRDAEFAIERFGRRRGAETGHADELTLVTEPTGPIALDRRLDANPRDTSENRSQVFPRLLAKQIKARRRDNGG